MLFLKLYTCLFNLNFIFSYTSNVEFVTILYRHGVRTPHNFYRNDPYQNLSLWSVGFGQLTNEGKEQQYILGKWFKTRYPHLFGDKYSYDKIYVQSTNIDRTLMSAQCNLAGIYPPIEDQIWDKVLKNWQPIPIHANDKMYDPILKGTPCKRYNYELNKLLTSPDIIKSLQEIKPFLEYLTNVTGEDVKTFKKAKTLSDILFVEKYHNLTSPKWLTEDILEQLIKCSKFYISFDCFTPKLQRLRTGPFFGKLIELLVNKTKGILEVDHKVIMYSAHDDTIVNILMSMNVFDYEFPSFSAALLFELRKIKGTYGISIYYKNNDKLNILKLKDCAEFCELEKFINILKPVTVPLEQWKSECELNELEEFILEYKILLILLLLILTILIVAIIIYFIRTGSNKEIKEYQLKT